MSRLSIGARYLYLALLPNMDRNGVMLGEPQAMRAICLPCDAKTRRSDVSRWLAELHQLGCIICFEHEDNAYVLDPQFAVHQNVYSNDPDTYRIPVETLSRVIRDYNESKKQLSFDPLNLNQYLNLNHNAETGNVDNSELSLDNLSRKKTHQGEGDGASHIPTASKRDDTEIAELNDKYILQRRRELGLNIEDGSEKIPGYGPAAVAPPRGLDS